MTLNTSTLRPGLLVAVKTSCRGNVRYAKVDLENEHTTESGEAQARWETTRTIADAAEFKAAKKVQSKVYGIMRRVCVESAFGLLCPEGDAALLEAAVAEAHAAVDAFNATAALTRLSVYVITGRVASDDVEAVRAINSEVRNLMDAMAVGIEKMDVSGIRNAADKARELGGMLSPDAEARVKLAIETARGVAKDIVKAGEAAAVEIDTRAIRKITEQRTAFLDMRDETEIQRPASEGRAIDLGGADAL